jgi:CRP-like cAMP-binding protein
LTAEALAALGPLERISLPVRTRLDTMNGVASVYFIEDGVASVVADVEGKLVVELGIVGREGMIGLNVVYGDAEDPFHVFMQVEGSALRADAEAVSKAMDASAELRSLLLRYARASSIQVATTALANGRSKLDERLARWLLMVSDRVGTTFPITHEFISIMLGVRRPGVTLAVQILEGNGLIKATRGTIIILDREGLIELAHGAYGVAERHYERLLGVSP